MKAFSTETRANIAAFFIGPLFLIPAVLAGIAILSVLNGQANEIGSALAVGVMVALYGLFVFAYPMTLIIGIPSILLLKKFGKYSLLSLVSVSFVGAGIVAVLIEPGLESWLLFCYCSASVSFGCWFVLNKWARP